jgi:hypothetical protein
MLTQPPINKELVQQTLYESYDLTTIDLIFVPQGEESWSYVVESHDKHRYVLKIYAVSPPEENVLEFVGKLHDVGHISRE